ncbi:MAG: stage II sporulation protein R, partial [Clostridia bacterium]|nr:stage II sporulation protein R [Clostridia bacterium]
DKTFFDTREYDDFSLPAGVYDALVLEIGKAKGKNWWCVIFPSICVGAAGDLSDTASDSAVNIAKNSQKFVVKFKIVEVYEKIKNKIFGLK